MSDSQTSASQPTTTTSGASSPIASGGASVNQGGTQLVAGGSLTIDATPAVEQAALDTMAALVDKQLAEQENTNAGTIQAAAASADAQGRQLSQILEAAANPSQAGANSTVLYVVIAVVAGLVAIFSFPKLFRHT